MGYAKSIGVVDASDEVRNYLTCGKNLRFLPANSLWCKSGYLKQKMV
jgi:hypothetical protein